MVCFYLAICSLRQIYLLILLISRVLSKWQFFSKWILDSSQDTCSSICALSFLIELILGCGQLITPLQQMSQVDPYYSQLESMLDNPPSPPRPRQLKTSFDFCDFDLDSALDQSSPLYFSPNKIALKSRQSNPEFLDFQLYSEAKAEKPGQLSEEEVRKDILKHCFEQQGSRGVQRLIEEDCGELRQNIFKVLFEEGRKVINHQFGNYVYQKFIQFNQDKIDMILSDILSRFLQHVKNQYGCRVVQKALQCMPLQSSEGKRLRQIVLSRLVELIQDPQGNHVVQKLFEVYRQKIDSDFIKVIEENKLASHISGCRVVQKCLQYLPSERTQRITERIKLCAVKLSVCQYGNYIISNLLEKGTRQDQQFIRKMILENLEQLSTNKYASNVVEKAIRQSKKSYKLELINILERDNPPLLVRLSTDQFGNYVMKKLFKQGEEWLKSRMRRQLQSFKQLLVHNKYGLYVYKMFVK